MAAIVQVWSAPSCEAGAICFGSLTPWVSCTGSEAVGTAPSLQVSVPRHVADEASVQDGLCLRVLSQSRGEQWWYVTGVADSDGDAALVQITAAPLRHLLTVRGLVRDGATFAFQPPRLSPAAVITTYVLANLAADSLSWLSLGTMDFTDGIELGTLDRVTRTGVLERLEQATGGTAVLRPVTSGGVLTGFAVDLLADPAAALSTVLLAPGANISALSRVRESTRTATAAVPFGSNGRAMQQTAWIIDSIAGTTPAWLLLRDPASGNPWPVREDDQLNTYYVQRLGGTQAQITDSRAVDSAVQIATVGSFVAGDTVTLVQNTDGDPIVELTSPAAIASGRGRLVGTVDVATAIVERNYVLNPLVDTWTSNTAPTGYTTQGTIGRYARTAVTTTHAVNLDGAHAMSDTTIYLKNGPVGARLYAGEQIVVGSPAIIDTSLTGGVGAGVYEFDSNGKVTVQVATGLSSAASDGDPVTLTFNGTLGPRRPASFPVDGGSASLARLVAGGVFSAPGYLRSTGASIIVPSGRTVQINASAGVTVTRVGSLGTAASFPSLLLINTGSGTTLATTAWPSVPAANSTVHQTLTVSTTLSSTTSVAAQVQSGSTVTYGPSSTSLQWQGVRWLSLWIGEGTGVEALSGSASNALWHRAQDVLQGEGTGTRYTVRGVDLDRLQSETGALQLGQRVRLRSALLGVDATVRIVKLDYDFAQTESLNLELGVIAPRLSAVTVSL